MANKGAAIRFPSVKRLMARLSLTRVHALELRQPAKSEPFDELLRAKTILQRFNDIKNFHGVENLCLPDGAPQRADGSDIEYDIWYANSGDPYTTTLLYVNGKFQIGNWGHYAEKK